jgi:hypothetical protein
MKIKKKKIMLLALYYFWRKTKVRQERVRQFYVRPAHNDEANQRCKIFWRYYQASDQQELKNFCGFTPSNFNELYEKISCQINNHKRTHRFPLSGKERLAIFFRFVRK